MNEHLQKKHDYIFELAAFNQWTCKQGGGNREDLERAKRYIQIVLNEVITPVQRKYIICYYVDQKNMEEIAREFGVSRSTVSRTIKRGRKKAYNCLRFASPLFINSPFAKRAKSGKLPRKKLEV